MSAEKTSREIENTVVASALRLRSADTAAWTFEAIEAACTLSDTSPSALASSGPSWMIGLSPTKTTATSPFSATRTPSDSVASTACSSACVAFAARWAAD